jgi:hypothetical protein
MNDSTVINRPPKSVTAHNGILSKNPVLLIAVTISAGSTAGEELLPIPDEFIIVDINPCTMLSSAIISSSPYTTAALAIAKRMNTLIATSGRFISANEPIVFITPTTKNSTNRARPIALTAPCIFTITFHTAPPLNVSGDCVSRLHNSPSFVFQTRSACSKLSIIHIGFLQSRVVPGKPDI